jgi:hypothetical protein
MYIFIGFRIPDLYKLIENLLEQKDFEIPENYDKNFLMNLDKCNYSKDEINSHLLKFLINKEYDGCKLYSNDKNTNYFGITLNYESEINFETLEKEKWKVYKLIKKLGYDLDKTDIIIKIITEWKDSGL